MQAARMWVRLLWVIVRDDLPRITARGTLGWLLGGVIFAQFWTIIPWVIWRHGIARMSPPGQGLLVLGLAAGALPMIGALPPLAFRRVVPRPAQGFLRAVSGAFAVWPVLWMLGMFPDPVLRAVPLVAASTLVLQGAPWGMLVALAAGTPWGVGVGLIALGAAGWVEPRTVAVATGGTAVPRGRLAAMVWRDLVCLWRLDRGVVLSAGAVAVPLAGLAWGFRVNGHLSGRALADAGAVMLCAIAPGAGAALGALRLRLGSAFHRPAWPVSALERVGVLATIAALWLLPTSTALAATGVDPRQASFPLTHLLLAAAAAWASARAPFRHGAMGWLALGAAGLVFSGYTAAALVVAPFLLWLAARSLR